MIKLLFFIFQMSRTKWNIENTLSLKRAVENALHGNFVNILNLPFHLKTKRSHDIKGGWDEVREIMQREHPEMVLKNRQLSEKYKR